MSLLPAPVYRPGVVGSFVSGWTDATGQTVGATSLDVAQTEDLDDDSNYAVEAVFVGFDSVTPTPVTYRRTGSVFRTGGGFATHASGSPVDDVDIDGGDPAITATIRVSGADSKVYFRATGKAGITIDWRCWYRVTKHS